MTLIKFRITFKIRCLFVQSVENQPLNRSVDSLNKLEEAINFLCDVDFLHNIAGAQSVDKGISCTCRREPGCTSHHPQPTTHSAANKSCTLQTLQFENSSVSMYHRHVGMYRLYRLYRNDVYIYIGRCGFSI